MSDIVRLHSGNSATFRPVAVPKHATVRWEPATDKLVELEWLKSRLPEERFDEQRLAALRQMDNPRSLEVLAKIGDAAADDVKAHFGL